MFPSHHKFQYLELLGLQDFGTYSHVFSSHVFCDSKNNASNKIMQTWSVIFLLQFSGGTDFSMTVEVFRHIQKGRNHSFLALMQGSATLHDEHHHHTRIKVVVNHENGVALSTKPHAIMPKLGFNKPRLELLADFSN